MAKISTAWGGYVRAHPPPKPKAKPKPPAPKAKAPPQTGTPPKPRVTTPPPVTGPPLGKITPGPGGIDPGFSRTPVNPFDAWLASDPRMLAQNPIFASRESQAYLGSGFYKDPTTGNLVVDQANTNPFSQVAGLRQQLGSDSENAMNAANSRGVLFSGANVAAQQHAQLGYQAGLSDALQKLQGTLTGIGTDRANLISSLYPDYVKQLPPQGAPPAVPKPPAAVKPPVAKPPALPKPALPKPKTPAKPPAFRVPPGFHI